MFSRNDQQSEICEPQEESDYLIWSEWYTSSLISYLNIIDYSGKDKKDIPFSEVPSYEDTVISYCKTEIYKSYKLYMMKRLKYEDNSNISSLIVKFMRVCDLYDVLGKNDEGPKLYCDIVDCLFDKGCDDPSVLLILWNDICAKSDRCREVVFDSLIGKHRKDKCCHILSYVLQNAQRTHFDFWGAWKKGQSLKKLSFCPVTAALLSGNVEQMTVLLQYGFQQNCRRVFTYDKYFHSLVNPDYLWLRIPLVEKTSKRQEILTETLLFLVQLSTCKSYRRRLQLLKCHQLLWSTIPDPIVTPNELLEEVENRFRSPPQFYQPSSIFCSKKAFLILSQFYGDLHQMDPDTAVQPRSLQQLSKCCIRDVLQEKMVLPHGICALTVPEIVREYLNVE